MRGCGICGVMIANSKALRTSRNTNRNLIWIMSLSLAGQMNKETARALADFISQKTPTVCHEHVVHAIEGEEGTEEVEYDEELASSSESSASEDDVEQPCLVCAL
ncbi:hypothetical protein TELCIR_12615, partial [Teladorsagia circumcincta]